MRVGSINYCFPDKWLIDSSNPNLLKGRKEYSIVSGRNQSVSSALIGFWLTRNCRKISVKTFFLLILEKQSLRLLHNPNTCLRRISRILPNDNMKSQFSVHKTITLDFVESIAKEYFSLEINFKLSIIADF